MGNGTPVPPRNLHRGELVTIVLRAGDKRITGKVRANVGGFLRIEPSPWLAGTHRYPHTAIRHAVRF
jgi:hypothetical protein